MLPKKSNLEAPRAHRVARWPEDAGKVKNLEVGDVLVVDGVRYGVRRGSKTIACRACAMNVANVKGSEHCIVLEVRDDSGVLPCEMCNGGSFINNDFYFERLWDGVGILRGCRSDGRRR